MCLRNTAHSLFNLRNGMNESACFLKLLFLGANTPWVSALAESLAAQGHSTIAIMAYDWSNYRRLPRDQTCNQPVAHLQREWWVYPPGYVGRLEPLFRPLLVRRLNRARVVLRYAANGDGSDETLNKEPWVIAPYPWFAGCLRGVPPERLIYFNLDDYVLYRPARGDVIQRQEAELVQRATLTLCLSQTQVETLRSRFPAKAESIRHFPLGITESLLNPYPEIVSMTNTVGYVGNLIDRVDWKLVAEVARRMPKVEFVFVGGLEGFGGGGQRPEWKTERAIALSLPNVKHIGSVPQEAVAEYYWNFSVFWIPYATDHAFNQASCPTKIMDGLASGRPVLSTDVPECRLYPDWISIIQSAQDAVIQIQQFLDTISSTATRESAQRQVEFVRKHHTWDKRAELLESWLL